MKWKKKVLLSALDACDGNISAAARRLGVSRNTMRYRLKKIRYRTWCISTAWWFISTGGNAALNFRYYRSELAIAYIYNELERRLKTSAVLARCFAYVYVNAKEVFMKRIVLFFADSSQFLFGMGGTLFAGGEKESKGDSDLAVGIVLPTKDEPPMAAG